MKVSWVIWERVKIPAVYSMHTLPTNVLGHLLWWELHGKHNIQNAISRQILLDTEILLDCVRPNKNSEIFIYLLHNLTV